MADLDLSVLFAAAPDAYLVLRPDLTIVAVTDAYLRATHTRREQLLGRNVFDAFPSAPSSPTGEIAAARASFGRVLATGAPDAPPPVHHPVPIGEGRFEERHWSVLNTPVLGPDGHVAYLVHRIEDITARRAASELGERYLRLLDLAPDAIVIVGLDQRIQLVNCQAEALFGYTRAELLGQPLDLLVPERFRGAHDRHLARFFAAPRARPMGSGFSLFGRRKDGSELPIEVSLSPQQGEHGMTVSAAIRDISERLRLEAAARVTADRLASAMESIQDALALFDADDRLVLCNRVFRALVHEPEGTSVVGRPYAQVLAAWIDDIDFVDEAARERFRSERLARRGKEATSTFDVRLRDGRRLRVSDRRTPEGGTVKTIWDLTDDELRAEELRAAREAAEAASAAKSEFLSSMSHELRTPMNAILGFAQLLERDKKEPLSPRHRERVAQILRGGEHLLRLINEVLDLARIEAGGITLSLEAVAVGEVLDEVRSTLEPIAVHQGIRLEVAPLPPGLPAIHADRTRFAQILMNLGSNAVKYNRPGGTVRFTAELAAGERVRLTVTDTGIGIPHDKQEKLFQPFQRAGQETGSIEGTGIGLVITRRLAELMGGSVGYRSTPDVGSSFWVELAIHEHAALAPTLRTDAARVPATSEGPTKLVLYVEDNPANVVFMRDLMSVFDNVELLTVPTAELGIELARARQPALVLMDINLPGMSGFDALAVLKADASTRAIPVIALTAAAAERERLRGEAAGFHRYMTKPVDVDELVSVVESLLKHDR